MASFDPWSPLNPSQEEDQSQERRLVWEDPHDAGAAFEVLVDAQRAQEYWGVRRRFWRVFGKAWSHRVHRPRTLPPRHAHFRTAAQKRIDGRGRR